jgi:hypothetical protein
MSERKPSHEVEGTVPRGPRQGCVEAQIWRRLQKKSAALKVPKNTVASIILKWNTLPRASHLPQSLSLDRRAKGGDQKPDGHSDRAPEFLCGDGITFQKDNHLFSTPPIRPLW